MGDFYLVGGNLSSLLYGQIFIFLGSFSVWAILCMGNLQSLFWGQIFLFKGIFKIYEEAFLIKW